MSTISTFISTYATSFIRTLLAAGAGYLVAKGIVSQTDATAAADSLSSGLGQIIVGVLVWGFTQIWSIVEKKIGLTTLAAAVAAPAVVPATTTPVVTATVAK